MQWWNLVISSINIENGEVIRINSYDELFKIVELYKDKYYIKENYSFYYSGEKIVIGGCFLVCLEIVIVQMN